MTTPPLSQVSATGQELNGKFKFLKMNMQLIIMFGNDVFGINFQLYKGQKGLKIWNLVLKFASVNKQFCTQNDKVNTTTVTGFLVKPKHALKIRNNKGCSNLGT